MFDFRPATRTLASLEDDIMADIQHPPLPCLSLFRVEGSTESLTTDGHGWKQEFVYLGEPGLLVNDPGTLSEAKRDARWDRLSNPTDADADAATVQAAGQDCLNVQRTHVYVQGTLSHRISEGSK